MDKKSFYCVDKKVKCVILFQDWSVIQGCEVETKKPDFENNDETIFMLIGGIFVTKEKRSMEPDILFKRGKDIKMIRLLHEKGDLINLLEKFCEEHKKLILG